MIGQDIFAKALIDPGQPVPAGVVDPKGRSDAARFNVYRNNVVVGLTDALEQAFPVVRKLVGDEFFRDMGNIFVRQHPPKSPILAEYGADFPRFLALFEHVRHLPYLPDVARLEQCVRHIYHAQDCAPLPPDSLNRLTEIPAEHLQFRFAPACAVMSSAWPIGSIWRANMLAPTPVTMTPEDVLIARRDFDVHVVALPRGGCAFVENLQRGQSLAMALERAPAGFDLTATMTALITTQAIAKVHEDATT